MYGRAKTYEVIIVGAGPAGAMTAQRLAQKGIGVLLLDRARFPRDKACGGGLTPKSFRQLDFDIDDLVLNRTRRIYLKGPHLAPTLIEMPNGEEVWMVRRREFDARLVEVAQARGVTLRDGEGVTRVETGALLPFGSAQGGSGQALARVETNRGTYRGRVVVGADGAESIVARQVGLRAERNRRLRAFALETEVPVTRDLLNDSVVVDYRFHLGYGWIFPKGAVYNVGVGTGDPREFRNLRGQLDRFIAENRLPIAGPVRAIGHRIPTWTYAEPLHRDNVILVGDAAGLADALWGEGIAYALMSGQIAALTIGDFLNSALENLETYSTRIQQLLGRELGGLYSLSKLVYPFAGLMFPFFARSRWMQQLAAGIISGDRSDAHIWRCACARKMARTGKSGRCDAVLSTLAPSGC